MRKKGLADGSLTPVFSMILHIGKESQNKSKKVKQNFDFLSKQMIWEVCKIKIKEFTTAYCTKKTIN